MDKLKGIALSKLNIKYNVCKLYKFKTNYKIVKLLNK